MRYDLLVRGGTVCASDGEREADVGILDGKIEAIGDLSQAEAAEVLDAGGLHILPGIIDTQVHFREPGMEHKEDLESGTRAAIMGGVTTIFEMPNTSPPTTSMEALEDKLRRAQGRAWCDHAFFVGAALDNLDQLAELERLPGTPGIKIFMGSSTGSLLVPDDESLRQVLLAGRRRCPIHAEDHQRLEERKALLSPDPHVREHPYVRDVECARRATERILDLSREAGRAVHILHLSTLDEIPLIRRAKMEGLGTSVEITPQHLYFSEQDYERLGTRLQMNPPIRSKEHRDALRHALREGFFDMVGSDHAPHTIEEKERPYPLSPSGMPGVQTLVPVMLTLVDQGLLSLREFVRLSSESPASLYGLLGKGKIEAGFDADLCIVDLWRTEPVRREWLQSKCGWSPYENEMLRGWPVHVVLRGQIVVREGELQGGPVGLPARFKDLGSERAL
ncbi:MAG TPA: dihydroorotase [Fimbriimonadaceae bacterium]|nr:dihydroorotase [Fimbriimonadaceae bacterium]